MAKRSAFGNVHWYRGLKARFDGEKKAFSRPTTFLGAFSVGGRAQQRESSVIAHRAQLGYTSSSVTFTTSPRHPTSSR